MKISVIIPMYNESSIIEDSLDQFYSYMVKTFDDFELIFVDDGSKDGCSAPVIEKEKQEILSEARKKALANENKIVTQAREEAALIIERAKVEAELEKQKAADDVKREMVVLASIMAGKVVKASIDTNVQESLINETLKEIGENTWLS